MNQRYTKYVPFDVAVALKNCGYPQDECYEGYDKNGCATSYEWKDYACPTYAQVIDWLIEEGLCVEIKCRKPDHGKREAWYGSVYRISTASLVYGQSVPDAFHWDVACNMAIRGALMLLQGDIKED